ncbi:MAG: hypothetical protein ABIV51_13810 [Saprospiraceae bacterium]
MSKSLSLTNAAALQAFVQTVAPDLLVRMFYKFKTAEMVRVHEGIKGRKILTELTFADNLVKKWRAQFDGNDNAVGFDPRILEVAFNKAELSVIPQELESNYLGEFRKKGQNQHDWPFEAFILDNWVKKIAQENENAVWRAALPASPTATDALALTFDGYLEIIKDLISATTITPVVTGAISITNAVGNVEKMWEVLDPSLKDQGVDIFCSWQIYSKYLQDYRERYGKYIGKDQSGSVQLDWGNATLHAMAGMGTSSRIVMTPAANLNIGFDSPGDLSNLNFEDDHRQIDIWMDYKLGVQIGIARDTILVVNDQV